ncbi:MAG: prepilin-type N-terminal cleavage/methylation domain-containing protein [Patescibacteria group bacterium]|nr:prepilin-type N-terminal cleavage/methylation domain-containing protein [Patescibacteria group bacterium]
MKKGFTVIELIVVVSIIAVISMIIIFNHRGFNSSVTLENVSQDIALTIRKAQVSAMGVKGVDVSGSSEFPGYGVRFALPAESNNPIWGDNKSFVYFADLPTLGGNKRYDPGLDCGNPFFENECLDVIDITTRDRISFLCVDGNCFDQDSAPYLDIVFSRPNPDAQFYFCINESDCTSGFSYVSIKIESPDEQKSREISIWNTGQISVN